MGWWRDVALLGLGVLVFVTGCAEKKARRQLVEDAEERVVLKLRLDADGAVQPISPSKEGDERSLTSIVGYHDEDAVVVSEPVDTSISNESRIRNLEGGMVESSNPRGNASVGGASVSAGAIGNPGGVVARMAPGFRRCYQKGLADDPEMKGSVRITARIGPSGEVQSAAPSGGGGLSKKLKSCVAGVVSSSTFDKPEGGGATIVIPVSFYPTG